MATIKKTSGDYVIQTPRLNGSNVTLDTDSVIITGNLSVLGNTTQFITNNTSITDRILTLNYGETGSGVTGNISGIEIDRGGFANVDLRWNESFQNWELTRDGTNYSNLGTTSATFIGSNVALGYAFGVYPASVPNIALIYSDTVEGGRTGIYVVNGDVAGDEMISKKRAFGLSLIL